MFADDTWDPALYERLAGSAIRHINAWQERAVRGDGPVVALATPAEVAEELRLDHWPTTPMQPGDFDDFLRAYLARSIALSHPHSLAHQVAVPDVPAAIADLVHGAINNPMAIYEMGPAAATVELWVVNWMLGHIGWTPQPLSGRGGGDHAAGVLTHGGSLANLTALLAARAAAAPEAWDRGTPDDLVLLAPPTSHYSVARAAGILGLGADRIVPLPVDERDVLDAAALPAVLDRVRGEGRRVMALVANAPSTATGLHDPLAEIGAICRERGIWFHVDAAHGASALVSPRLRGRLDGIALADSVTWDAHKMLRTSGLVAAVLFRRADAFDMAFQQEASYLFYEDEVPGVDLIHRSVECTKAGLGLKVLLELALRGEAGVAAYVEGRYEAARRFHDIVAARPGFSAPFAPESNILCLRRDGSDDLQVRIRRRLLDEGRFHLSSATVHGRRYLRLTVTTPSAGDRTMEELLDTIERVAAPVG